MLAPKPIYDPILSSRILIVEDSEVSSFMLKRMLEEYGFSNIVCAADGKEALENIHILNPALILLDLLMPQMNGYEFCERLRKLPEFRDVPVLVQTAVESQEERTRSFALGATDLITKPVNAKEVAARARVHLENMHLFSSLQQYQTRVAGELAQARQMQRALLPGPSLLDFCHKTYHLDIAAHFEPSLEMSGDLWGVTTLGKNECAFYMTDFAGKGVGAALSAFRLHTLMHELPVIFEREAGKLVSTLSERLRPLLGRGQFATMFYGVLDTHADELLTPPPQHLLRFCSNNTAIISKSSMAPAIPLP